MTDKTSMKTEDAVVDQTFAGFDTEMTSGSQDGAAEATPPAFEKKKSSNMPIFIGGGIAALGIVGYMFLKAGNAPQQAPQKPVQQQAQQNQPAQNPLAQNQPANPVAPAASEATNPAAAFLNGQAPAPGASQPSVETPVVQPVAASQPASVDAPVAQTPVTTPAVVNAPVAQPTQQVQPQVASTNNSKPVAVANELGNLFEQQKTEFKTAITGLDERVTVLEDKFKTQDGVNQNVDKRLTALEQGKKSSVAPSTTVSDTAEKKPVVKRTPVVKKPVVKENVETNVLVDKREVDNKKEAVVKPAQVEYPKYSVHSVYSGRVWIKNEDGSLSTYQSGDRLPSGEVIKGVNDETFEIKTDKRVIVK